MLLFPVRPVAFGCSCVPACPRFTLSLLSFHMFSLTCTLSVVVSLKAEAVAKATNKSSCVVVFGVMARMHKILV